jgi:mono/diheme cytochrome c family protein
MGRVLRWVGIIAGGLVCLVAITMVVAWVGSQRVLDRRYAATAVELPPAPAVLAADAPRRARIYGCMACHGPTMEGQLLTDIPFVARVETPNVSARVPAMTDQQLAQVIREGIAADGRSLWIMPALPRLADEELAALISWLRTLPPGTGPVRGVHFRPLGRFAVMAGKIRPSAVSIGSVDPDEPPDLGPGHDQGRHIAATVCAECHGFSLRGVQLDDGSASPDLAIVAGYTAGEFTTLLKTGKATGGRELGMMSQNARSSFVAMDDAEISAVYGYLKARAEAR